MEQSPSWKANRSSASNEIHGILQNWNVHNRDHKSPPPVPTLTELDQYDPCLPIIIFQDPF
jgi:hypothetical protein